MDKILDKTGNKGTGKMTVKEAAEQSVPCPTIAAALDARFVSALKDTRIKAAEILRGPQEIPQIDRGQLLDDLRQVRGRWGETWGEKMVETCWEKRGKKRGDKPGEGGGGEGGKEKEGACVDLLCCV